MPDIGSQDQNTFETARVRLQEKLEGMSFIAHLEELRMRVIKSLLAVGVGFCACWWKHEAIYSWVQNPIMDALHRNGLEAKLVYLNPTEPFNMYLKMSMLAGLFVTSPFVLYQVWAFVAPGLYRREKRYLVPFLVSTVMLFCAGGYTGYRIVYPRALDFLVGFGKQFQPMITIGEYTDLFLVITLGMGVIFEMPILAGFLAAMGVVKTGFLIKNLRYAILLIFIVAAIVTPTPDVMSMCIFAAPMLVLYFVSIGVVWFLQRRRAAAKLQG
ncbi:MAG: twin-arginine translocase subunit TatC [Terriglobales bacterium]